MSLSKEMYCLSCGKKIVDRHTDNRKYCSNQCMQDYYWSRRVSEIESGKVLSSIIMKKYLIYVNGDKCMNPDCGWDWSKKCIVELEHIDGDYRNNELDNLTLLCPNCHSMTDTYKGKNVGKGRHYRRQRYKDGKSY